MAPSQATAGSSSSPPHMSPAHSGQATLPRRSISQSRPSHIACAHSAAPTPTRSSTRPPTATSPSSRAASAARSSTGCRPGGRTPSTPSPARRGPNDRHCQPPRREALRRARRLHLRPALRRDDPRRRPQRRRRQQPAAPLDARQLGLPTRLQLRLLQPLPRPLSDR